MIKEFIAQWWMYHQNMEQYFKSIPEIHTLDYKDIVKALVENVLNCGAEECYKISTDIHVIDDGDYQGTQIFFVHNDTYQPCVDDYFFTDNYYGTCSGCDTLLSIIDEYNPEPATDEQVKQLMKLAFDLLRNFKPLVKGAKYKGNSVHLTEEDVEWNG